MSDIPKNTQSYSFPLIIALGILVLLLWFAVLQSSQLIQSLGMPSKLFFVATILVPLMPIFWFIAWKNTRLCLSLYTVLMLFGDGFAALCAPAMIAATLPNCLYLMLQYRTTWIRYLVIPLVILGALYFFMAIFMDTINHPVQLTNRMQFDPGFPPLTLGWLGSLLGYTIVYPLIYIPFALYDTSKHPSFQKYFLIVLSMIINGILLFGIIQYVQSGGSIRVASIMRLPTRLGPFIVIFQTLGAILLLEAKNKKAFLYWCLTMGMSTVVVFMTQTRIAIIALVLMAFVLFISMISSKNILMIKRFLIAGVIVTLIMGGLMVSGKVDLLSRFDSGNVESGNSSRERIMEDYQAGVNLENVTWFQKAGHTLFGFGMFREREFAHFNLHDTLSCSLSVFGIIGTIFYYLPYLAIALVCGFQTFKNASLVYRPRFAMAGCTIAIFFLTGAFHNKLYSPIETAFIWLTAGLLLWPILPGLFHKSPNTPH